MRSLRFGAALAGAISERGQQLGLRGIQVGLDHAIDFVFQQLQFFVGQRPFESVVALGFLALDMSAEAPVTIEQAPHGLVEDVFGAVHAWVNLLFHYRLRFKRWYRLCKNG